MVFLNSEPLSQEYKTSGKINNYNLANRIFVILTSIATAACILTITFLFLLTPFPTQFFASINVQDQISPLSHDELVYVAIQTLNYVNGDSSADLPLGTNSTTSYDAEVISHLDDVAGLFFGIKIAALLSSIALIVCILLLIKQSKNQGFSIKSGISKFIRYGAWIVIGLAAVLTIACLINFQITFNFLHSLFFSSGSWVFPYDSLLICALPESFWVSMAALWVGLIAICCVILLLVSKALKRNVVSA